MNRRKIVVKIEPHQERSDKVQDQSVQDPSTSNITPTDTAATLEDGPQKEDLPTKNIRSTKLSTEVKKDPPSKDNNTPTKVARHI